MLQEHQDWATLEMQGTLLPDERFRPNLIRMCHRLSVHPDRSFSSACGPAVRKSANRLFSKEETDLQSGHIEQTILRCKTEDYVLVLEDTTDLNYNGHKQTTGLGDLGGGETPIYGICVHSALVLSRLKEPLGLLDQHVWPPVSETRKSHFISKLPIEQKESYKWLQVLNGVNSAFLSYEGHVIVVGDREGDFYEHFAAPRNVNVDLVIRLLHRHRKIIWNDQSMTINDLLLHLPYAGDYKLNVAAQKGRKERVANLSVYYGQITCPPSRNRKGEAVPMWVVCTVELNPPEGVTPLEWNILTTLAVESYEDAVEVINIYTSRWVIERFHYVLKQGMRVERLQFDNFTRLANAVKLCSIVAWQLLRIAYLSKAKPENDADQYFDKQETQILEKITNTKIKTVKEHINALGKLVGFAPSRKQPFPGEKLTWQAIQQLNSIKMGFLLAQSYGTG